MRNDSIVGVTESGEVVASRDVRLLEVRRFSTGKTIGLVVGTLATVAGVMFIGFMASIEN